DDKYYLAASVNSGMGHNVLLAGNSYDETFLLKTAFETLSGMDMYENASLKQVDYNDLSGIDIGQYDIIMFSSIGKVLEGVADDLESFVQTGGRIVFFLTGECDSTAVKALWAKDILPALPGERLSKSTHIQAFSTSSAVSSSIGSDDPISQSLLNYEMDRVQVSDYYKLDCHSQGECLWALESGDGFVCSKELGKGKTVIVNTSVDDSAGTLMKSNACLAFCAFLLGNEAKVEEYSFRLDERVRIPASDMELRNADRTDFQVYNCDGQMSTVRVSDSFLVLNDVHGTGWVKTLTSPTRWAGVNLCAGETDMTALTMDQIENAAGNAFVAGFDEKIQMDKSSADFRYKPLWKYFAWVLVVLLLLEITAANTMKR
ncbi:MAG: hypothetical protein KAS23_14775, partial [Anaerohalosphaera sp.]|nr:hypothetical protein [Anaerohalosphaera sp.]